MVYVNDTPFKGTYNADDRLKHRNAVREDLPTKFDGSKDQFYRHSIEFIQRIKDTGLVAEFDIRIRENPRPDAIAECAWADHPDRFETINFLEDYTVATLTQVKAERDRILATIAGLDAAPRNAGVPGAKEFASKQHRSWIAECLRMSWTAEAKDRMDAHTEEHDGDGVVMWMCCLQEFAGSSREALIAAQEALHPNKLNLDSFNMDVKSFTSYCRTHFRMLLKAGRQPTEDHFIHIYTALKKANTEEFRLQIIDWYRNWRQGAGAGSQWTMMQLLAKVDLEYTRLLELGQWETNDPNSTVVALLSKVNDLEKSVATWKTKAQKAVDTEKAKATKAENKDGNKDKAATGTANKTERPHWIPKPTDKQIVEHKGCTWKYCSKCLNGKGAWTKTHTTEEHTGVRKDGGGRRRRRGKSNQDASSNLANIDFTGLWDF